MTRTLLASPWRFKRTREDSALFKEFHSSAFHVFRNYLRLEAILEGTNLGRNNDYFNTETILYAGMRAKIS